MKYAAITAAAALAASAWGQMARPVATVPRPAATVLTVATPGVLRGFETGVDEQIAGVNRVKPIDVVGGTRCFYLHGIGAILSTKVELMQTPTINPFRHEITPQEAADVFRTKTANLVLLRQTMKSTMISAAKDMEFLPQTEQIVFAVSLIYQPWEDTKGLPTQIVMRADRRDALNGNITTEEQ